MENKGPVLLSRFKSCVPAPPGGTGERECARVQGNFSAVRPGTAQLLKAFPSGKGAESPGSAPAQPCTDASGRVRTKHHTQPVAPEQPGDSLYLSLTLSTAFHNTKIALPGLRASLSHPQSRLSYRRTMRLETLVRNNSYRGRVNGRKPVLLGTSCARQGGTVGRGLGLGEGLGFIADTLVLPRRPRGLRQSTKFHVRN